MRAKIYARIYFFRKTKSSAAKSFCRAIVRKIIEKTRVIASFFKYIYLKQKTNYGTILLNRQGRCEAGLPKAHLCLPCA